MATHRFSINVPNPTAKAASVLLTLEAAKNTDLKNLCLNMHPETLEVENFFITTDQCAKEGKQELQTKLDPYASLEVFVVIQTSAVTKPGNVFYNLIDKRGGTVVGGVLLACQEPVIPDGPGTVIGTKNPCPAILAADIYLAEADGDPRKPIPKNKIPFGVSVDIVAAITNPTPKPLSDVVVYLEHLGISGLEFEPGVWNVGTLEPKDVFYATWATKLNPLQNPKFSASVVVTSQRKDPVRLNSSFALNGRPD